MPMPTFVREAHCPAISQDRAGTATYSEKTASNDRNKASAINPLTVTPPG